MTQKRKAELQRKLSMAPVAKPPSGLSDRLKADIPDYLSTRRDRERLSQSVAFSMRVAASIILLVTSVFLTIQLLSRDEHGAFRAIAPDEKEIVASRVTPASSAAPPALQQAEAIETASTSVESDTPLSAPAAAPPAPRPQRGQLGRRDGVQMAANDLALPPQAPRPQSVSAAFDAAVAVGAVGGQLEETEASAGFKDHDASVSEPVAQAQTRDPQAMSGIAVAAAAPPPAVVAPESSRREARAKATSTALFAPVPRGRATIFGISTDPGAFTRLKDKLDRGEKPTAPVDVAALVNHFAGSPDSAPQGVELQVETSRMPLSTDNRAVVRYTMDTSVDATAKLTIQVNATAIESYHVLGGNVGPAEEVLSAGQSVTGLMEIRLKQPLPHATEVLSVVLEYSTPRGRHKKHSRDIRVVDLMRPWSAASRRHRLATLAAIWGESLLEGQPDAEIARTATALAEEKPEDVRAGELAAAAIASSRRRTSAPTGSGR